MSLSCGALSAGDVPQQQSAADTAEGAAPQYIEVDPGEFTPWVPAELQDAARNIVAELDPAEAQIVIDEWADCMALEKIDISPLGYLQAMVRRYQDGDSRSNLAKAMADARAKQLGE